MRPHGVYLHGFASSPRSAKGVSLGERLRPRLASWSIPPLEGEPAGPAAFRALTMHGIADRAQAAVDALPADGAPVLLIGSSLGGYVAAWLAAAGRVQRATALLLIAPAFGFTDTWEQRLGAAGVAEWRERGERPFFHHSHERELPLGYAFLESCRPLAALPGEPGIPVAIVHGRQDESVDHRRSIDYATSRTGVELHLVEGDHRLTEARHEELIAWCAMDLMRGG